MKKFEEYLVKRIDKKNNIKLCQNCNVWDEVAGEELISPEYGEKVSISQTTI